MSHIYLVPVGVFLIFQVTFIGTYIVAVLSGHVVPTVPYISDSATYSPESCIFGQMINFGAVLLGLAIYIRHKQVVQVYGYHPDLNPRGLVCNEFSAYFGAISSIGVSVVANFQETNVRYVHYAGAFCAFGFGTIYFLLQSIVSNCIRPIAGSKLMTSLRIIMTLVCAVLFCVQTVTGLLSHIYFKGDNPRKWYPSDGGWLYHVISSVSEWIVATVFCFYILSYTNEFRNVELKHPEISLISYQLAMERSYTLERSLIVETPDRPLESH